MCCPSRGITWKHQRKLQRCQSNLFYQKEQGHYISHLRRGFDDRITKLSLWSQLKGKIKRKDLIKRSRVKIAMKIITPAVESMITGVEWMRGLVEMNLFMARCTIRQREQNVGNTIIITKWVLATPRTEPQPVKPLKYKCPRHVSTSDLINCPLVRLDVIYWYLIIIRVMESTKMFPKLKSEGRAVRKYTYSVICLPFSYDAICNPSNGNGLLLHRTEICFPRVY